MPIVFDAVAGLPTIPAAAFTVGNASWSHVHSAAADTIIVIGAHYGFGWYGASCGGVSMTMLGQVPSFSYAMYMAMWGIKITPGTAGTKQIIVSANAYSCYGNSASYSGVASFGTAASSTGNTASVTVASATGRTVVAGCASMAAITSMTGGTNRIALGRGFSVADAPGGASNPFTFTSSGARASVAVNLIGSDTPPPVTVPTNQFFKMF